MQKIGILIETKDGEIKKANFGVITAARGENRDLYAFFLDAMGEDHKNRLHPQRTIRQHAKKIHRQGRISCGFLPVWG